MIKIEHTVTASPEQMEFIIEGMRNPMNSWDKSDSFITQDWNSEDGYRGDIYVTGPNDWDLMKRLANAGSDDRKFLRQMPVFVRITAPLYWWKEADTYKVGTVANSCSTMHKIAAKEFTLDDFSTDNLSTVSQVQLGFTIDFLNHYRDLYNNWDTNAWQVYNKKEAWWQMIQMLPSSYNQTRNVTMNYEVLKNMYHARKNHKLDEWHVFCDWVKTLPYSELITGEFM